MNNNDSADETEEVAVTVTTVAESVLTIFFDELAKTEGLAEIAPKLRKVVLEDGVFAEPAVRAALFPDTP